MGPIHLHKETHRHILGKFLLLAAVLVGYFAFVSWQYGVTDGFSITWLTWSFFVLCTPIADAGFLIDFPTRLILNLRMIFSETMVWMIAISLNIYNYFFHPELYAKTELLKLFKHILDQPLPFWIIILLSALGTFLSVRFGDELWDVARHKDRTFHKKHVLKWRVIFMVTLIVLVLVAYNFLLKSLGVAVPF